MEEFGFKIYKYLSSTDEIKSKVAPLSKKCLTNAQSYIVWKEMMSAVKSAFASQKIKLSPSQSTVSTASSSTLPPILSQGQPSMKNLEQ